MFSSKVWTQNNWFYKTKLLEHYLCHKKPSKSHLPQWLPQWLIMILMTSHSIAFSIGRFIKTGKCKWYLQLITRTEAVDVLTTTRWEARTGGWIDVVLIVCRLISLSFEFLNLCAPRFVYWHLWSFCRKKQWLHGLFCCRSYKEHNSAFHLFATFLRGLFGTVLLVSLKQICLYGKNYQNSKAGETHCVLFCFVLFCFNT